MFKLGFDGGLPANFLMELYDAEKMELKYQVTNKVPIFEVSSLDPGVPIKLYLYAENAKGTSDPAIIDDSAQNQQRLGVEGMSPKKEVEDIIYIFLPLNSYVTPSEIVFHSIELKNIFYVEFSFQE